MDTVKTFFTHLFSTSFLNQGINLTPRQLFIIISMLGLLLITGIALHIFIDKKTHPKFYKKFIKRIGDFLIYLPILLVFVFAILLAGFEVKNLFLLVLIIIWLIWLIILIYYRLVKVSKLWYKYQEVKRKEKYQKNAKPNR